MIDGLKMGCRGSEVIGIRIEIIKNKENDLEIYR